MTEPLDELRVRAEQHFGRHLAANRYPGRGIVLGRLADGDWAQIYWLMGRSEQSRNRRLVSSDQGELRTEARDPSLVVDPTNIIYRAMLEFGQIYLVSNGDHTDTLRNAVQRGDRFEDAIAQREREDDAPHFTPRIAAMLDLRDDAQIALAILRANAADPSQSDRAVWRLPPPPPGLGYGLTTYRHDGHPLPPFAGDPLWLPLAGDANQVADAYWQALDAENRIAVAVKVIRDGHSDILFRQSS